MLKRFNEIIESEFNSFKDKNVFLAISGGKDSMTLSHLLKHSNIPHTLLHCNFKLRNEDADNDEQFILKYGAKNNLKVITTQFQTEAYANSNKLTIQEAARNLRYDWFSKIMTNENDILLTAHHRDDSVETFFINLMRGTSIQGLSGISASINNIYRPLLKFSQQDILEYIEKYALAFRQDKSNFDSKYLRNDLRNNVIPLIESKSTNFKQKMSRTMDSIDAMNNWIDQKATDFKKQYFIPATNDTINVEIEHLINQADVFKEYILKEFDIHRANLVELNKLIIGVTGAVFKTKTHFFLKNRNEIIIQKNQIDAPTIHYEITEFPANITLHSQSFSLKTSLELSDYNKHNSPQQIDLEKIHLPIIIRKWKQGDRIQPLGMRGSKLVSDILINKKLSVIDKEHVYVLESNKTLLVIIGLIISEKAKITEKTLQLLSIQKL